MIRKLRLEFGPTAEACALAGFLARSQENPPESWATLMSSAERAFAAIVEERRALEERLDEIGEATGVEVAIDEIEHEDGDGDASDDHALGTFDAEFDLPAVMSDPDEGLLVLRAISTLITFVDGLECHGFEARLSGKVVETEQVEEVLKEYAEQSGFSLDPEGEPDIDLGDEDEEGEEEDEEDEWAEVPPEPRATPSTPPSSGKGRVSGRFSKAGGTFGGLDEEASAPAGPVRGTFGEEEHFFLHHSRLVWPVSADELQKAYRLLMFHSHPDRAPGDPAAEQRFKFLMEGHNKLKRRLAVG